ncbi:MAG: hypothetical protein IPH08_03375 [Rhodocyclaceae bacterium]|nr:hypothetical protein [Rhodocyclaceae bacterium]MBK6906205.1 hypothetical protein [Rhodocyclaceae bacterium]
MERRMNARCVSYLTAIALVLAGCAGGGRPAHSANSADPSKLTVQERVKAGRALWEQKCRTVAGEKIYRTVDNVEGILLMKLRPNRGEREWNDPDWPGAAFAEERTGDSYIASFLGYELPKSYLGGRSPSSPSERGYIGETRQIGSRNGYRWADVIDDKDGKRWRYTGSDKVVGQKDKTAFNVQLELSKNPNYDLNVYRWTLDKKPAPDPEPRYGVTFEDHVIPEERALGVASSTIRVIDLHANEVLAEKTFYVVRGTSSIGNPSPWLTAYGCHFVGSASTQTRYFVDQVAKPSKEN